MGCMPTLSVIKSTFIHLEHYLRREMHNIFHEVSPISSSQVDETVARDFAEMSQKCQPVGS